MKNSRRWFESGQLYEACIRVRSGIPFTTNKVITAILLGILGRVQHDQKIVICHMVWMGNHLHILFLIRDAEECSRFFCQLQKQITDAFKKMLRLKHLNLWEGEPSIAKILDLEAAKERLSYFYCNPPEADLVDTIDDYEGISTWQAFLSSDSAVTAENKALVPWVRRAMIPELRERRTISKFEQEKLLQQFSKIKGRYQLTFHPWAWLKVFGITERAEIELVKADVLNRIRAKEEQLRGERRRKGTPIVGAKELAEAPIMRPHTPKKSSRRIYVISSERQLRVQYIYAMRDLTAYCRDLYQRSKCGERVEWPPGVFAPRPPLLINAWCATG